MKKIQAATVLFILLCSAGILFLLYADVLPLTMPMRILCAAIWLILSIAVFFVVTVGLSVFKSIKKTNLLESCRPRDYISFAEQELMHTTDPSMRNALYINLFAAYHDLCEAEKAISNLMKVKTNFPGNRLGEALLHVYRINRSVYYQTIGDLKHAALELEAAETLLAASNANGKVKEAMQRANLARRFSLAIEQGNFEGAKDFFLDFFDSEKSLRTRVIAKSALAQIHMHYGETEKAAEACRFVIANGGETHYVREAKELLTTIV